MSKSGVYRAIRILKEKNQSLCAIRKNFEMELNVVNYLINPNEFSINRNNTYVNMYYHEYSKFNCDELYVIHNKVKGWIDIASDMIDGNGSKILRLRGNKWSI